MASSFTIRPYDPADLPAMQEVRRAAFAPVFQSFRELVGPEIGAVAFVNADAEQARLLETVCASQRVLVVSVDDAIVGFVSFTLDEAIGVGELRLNAVHPNFAGRGFGAAMYAHVLERMKEAGMKVATVGTGGDVSHAPARRAYEKVGFGPGIPSVTLYRKL